jgi:2,3-bisphosphoglycerate-independent phosphoglycerate mutase
VKGATGYTDTNYVGKAEKALEALREKDFVFIHVEAPDEMGHEGNTEGKVKALEDFDEKVVGTVLNGIGLFGDYRVLVLSDHPTPVAKKTHVSEPSPFAVISSVEAENLKNGGSYGETSARESRIVVSPGYRLMDGFIGDWRRFIEDRRR